ncbi:MAG TPA: mechanosensitive ion channel family protein [Chitinophagaceae bacterium]|nr:mechanosensitive ion channel family protein [Chitinophagaceae bacterium]
MRYLQKFYDQAFHWLLTFGPRIVIAIIVLIAGQWLLKIVNRWLKATLANRKVNATVKTFLSNLLAVFLQVMLVLLLMQILGIGMTLFATVIAGFSVAAGLALSGTLQNFASGVLILLLRPYKVGDNIITQGQEGTVTSIQLFYTVILTFDNKTVIVPNSKLSNEIIQNLSREGNRRLDIELKFKYSFEFEHIKNIIAASFESISNIIKDPPLRVGVSKLDTDNYTVVINTWIPAHGFEDGKLVINEKLMADLKKAGIIQGAS